MAQFEIWIMRPNSQFLYLSPTKSQTSQTWPLVFVRESTKVAKNTNIVNWGGAILQIWYPYKWKLNLQHSQTDRQKIKKVKLRKAMEKKIALAFLLVLFLVSSDLDVTVADAFDCLDACETACVTSNPDCNIFFIFLYSILSCWFHSFQIRWTIISFS